MMQSNGNIQLNDILAQFKTEGAVPEEINYDCYSVRVNQHVLPYPEDKYENPEEWIKTLPGMNIKRPVITDRLAIVPFFH